MARNLFFDRYIGGYLQVSGVIYEENQLLSLRYASINRIIAAGSGLIGGGTLAADRIIHAQVGSGLYLLDDLFGFDTAFGDNRYALSGSVASSGSAAFSGLSFSGLNDVIDSPWLSGNSARFDGLDWRPINLDVIFQASGLYQLSGTSYTKTESDTRYAFQTTQIIAGSGLIGGGDLSTDRTIHVQVGSGLYLLDDLVGFSTTFGDTRYALSGVESVLAGSGLYTNSERSIYHVGSGYGIIVTDSGVMINSGQLDARYMLSGTVPETGFANIMLLMGG